jgi:hypothetical protein
MIEVFEEDIKEATEVPKVTVAADLSETGNPVPVIVTSIPP